MILGGTGQDGQILTKIYKEAGVRVFNISPSHPSMNHEDGSVTNIKSSPRKFDDFKELFERYQPSKVINFASKSSVFFCQNYQSISKRINFELVQQLVSSLDEYAISRIDKVRLIHASSSEMFGTSDLVCTEETTLSPKTVYGKHKAEAYKFLKYYVPTSENLHIQNITFFNHESELRQENFVSQKICKSVAEIYFGLSKEVPLGNTQIRRDWSYAYDFMEAVFLLNESAIFSDYIFASGELHSIQDILTVAFSRIGVSDYQKYIFIDAKFLRNAESDSLTGDSSRFRNKYGWQPKTSFNEMISKMTDFQINKISREQGLSLA
jgi:GDPmannose 4,6-dehydratase